MNIQDISVVIPTRNSRHLLELALPQMQEWGREVGEVIVVDSESTDGTLELLRAALDFPQVRFTTHPPGLYASWNHGIGQASREWLHISTAGDAISLEDLQSLLSVANSSAADVIVAPPVFADEEGIALPDPNWPLFQLLQAHPDRDEFAMSGVDLVCFALLHCRPPLRYNSWLGSSASNLYRTKLLQAHPFPTTAGHFGDTLFGLEQAWRIHAVFCRRRCGKFIVHHHTDLRSPDDRKQLFTAFSGAWQSSFSRLVSELELTPATEQVIHFLLSDLQQSGDAVEQLRDKLWSETRKKDRLREQLESLKAKAGTTGHDPGVPKWLANLFRKIRPRSEP